MLELLYKWYGTNDPFVFDKKADWTIVMLLPMFALSLYVIIVTAYTIHVADYGKNNNVDEWTKNTTKSMNWSLVVISSLVLLAMIGIFAYRLNKFKSNWNPATHIYNLKNTVSSFKTDTTKPIGTYRAGVASGKNEDTGIKAPFDDEYAQIQNGM